MDARLYGRRGVGRYVSGLFEGLTAAKAGLDIVSFLRAGGEEPPSGKKISLPDRNYANLEQKQIPSLARAEACDVLHMVDNMACLKYPGTQVLTVHDLFFLESPSQSLRGGGWKAWAAWFYRKRNFEKSLDSVRKIICPSAWSAGALEKAFPKVYRRLVVVRPGVGRPFEPQAKGRFEALRAQYKLGPALVLVPGAAVRRKNVGAAVRGFLRARKQGLPETLSLAVYGLDAGSLARHWPELVEPLKAGAFRVLGSPPDEDLAGLIAGAWCLLHPSLGEGVGFAALEAMACGCPLITTNRTALPEFVGDAGLFCDGSEAGVAEKLLELSLKKGLWVELASRGPRQASLFPWSATAEAHEAVYRSCLPGGGPD